MRILYLCPDFGVPVLGRKGAAVHVRSLTRALRWAGHAVQVVAAAQNTSQWELSAPFEVPLLCVRPGASTTAAAGALREFTDTLRIKSTLPGELRRVLYNADLTSQLLSHFESDPPDFIYERASLYATA